MHNTCALFEVQGLARVQRNDTYVHVLCRAHAHTQTRYLSTTNSPILSATGPGSPLSSTISLRTASQGSCRTRLSSNTHAQLLLHLSTRVMPLFLHHLAAYSLPRLVSATHTRAGQGMVTPTSGAGAGSQSQAGTSIMRQVRGLQCAGDHRADCGLLSACRAAPHCTAHISHAASALRTHNKQEYSDGRFASSRVDTWALIIIIITTTIIIITTTTTIIIITAILIIIITDLKPHAMNKYTTSSLRADGWMRTPLHSQSAIHPPNKRTLSSLSMAEQMARNFWGGTPRHSTSDIQNHTQY